MSGEQKIAIRVRDLEVSYDDNRVLQNINFDVHEGEILVILGESGCGKSTLLRHMLMLRSPQGGSVHYGDIDLCQASENELDEIRRD
ncbi:MAG TPA: ATP-binding cassette domain-containing protein, partial [Bacteroidetes bacterium]|nr:ATP-binding cassette domain-containing protein [Bacteroidota bacterium]HEX05663.1 ATP-binding cassette domain-containing protein [Bacteroidota bacterium]